MTMRYQALACDYDGTLATEGVVDPSTICALEELGAAGYRLLLVTGRQVGDLEPRFPRLGLFARIVAENGAVLVCPATRERRFLAARPADAFVQRLRARGVTEVSVGDVVVAMSTPHQAEALETIREMGLDLHVILNREAVMVLPSSVDKRSGLQEALADLGLSFEDCVGVGDAENDLAFLTSCALGVAVGNALPSLKRAVDLVTVESRGAGVEELVRRLLAEAPAAADAARPLRA